jgi:hypothetical protein
VQGDTLDNGEVVNLWFKNWGKAYYSFEGSNTIFYIFDSQLDWYTSMDTYKWEQIDWFAKALESETHDHIAIGVHIWITSNETTPLAQNIASVVVAYNNKTTVTLNGETYDFSNATGHIEFVIAGHTHADKNFAIDDSVPVIITTNAGYGNAVVTFDLVFADYTARTIDFIRVGNGSNRKFSLDTGLLITS